MYHPRSSQAQFDESPTTLNHPDSSLHNTIPHSSSAMSQGNRSDGSINSTSFYLSNNLFYDAQSLNSHQTTNYGPRYDSLQKTS